MNFFQKEVLEVNASQEPLSKATQEDASSVVAQYTTLFQTTSTMAKSSSNTVFARAASKLDALASGIDAVAQQTPEEAPSPSSSFNP